MANLTSMLKDEISRISRKEIRGETDKLKKTSSVGARLKLTTCAR